MFVRILTCILETFKNSIILDLNEYVSFVTSQLGITFSNSAMEQQNNE